ncbi:MAG: tRNA lysidine(34) synthetase TilS [Gammaproteobacteria bacterium]|nr:tRNA lysidine(34) synthetase TilS [Gammaproteobacteria bacterium]
MPVEASLVARTVAETAALAPWFDGQAKGALWVAFSGGRDSTVLLHALRDVPGVAATHIDHGLNADSAAWARHCAHVAADLRVGFEARRVCVAVGGNREQAARSARYAAWRELLRSGDLLALAHHADDQAETRLWQLLTGREPGGMPVERRLGAGLLVRPMLGIRRAAITAYAEHYGLRWIEDPSNEDLSFDRNYIRARVLPRIEERFPDAVERLARRRPASAPVPLAASAVSTTTIENWLRAAGLPVARAAVAQIRRQTSACRDRMPQVTVAPGIRAWRHADHWHLVRESAPLAAQPVTVGVCARIGSGALGWHRDGRGLPEGMRLTVRPRNGGERLRVDGRNLTKSVKALLHDAGVPPWRRPGWPLLFADDGALVALPGLAVAEGAAVADGWQPQWTPVEDF